MIALLAMIAAAVLIVWTPIEARRVANGWVRPRYRDDPPAFRARYRRQLTTYGWVGLALGVGSVVLAFLDERAEGPVPIRLIGGLLWIGVGMVSFLARRRVAAVFGTEG